MTNSRDRHQRSFSDRPCRRPLHDQDRVLEDGWHQVLCEGQVSHEAKWHSGLISNIKGLDFVTLKSLVKPWRQIRRYLCGHGLASCSQIFKDALTISHSVDKVGFRSSNMVDDSVMPAFALAVSYMDKASKAWALKCATEGLV